MDHLPLPQANQQNPLADLSESKLNILQQTLSHLIDHVDDRIHYAESRRAPLILAGGALFAGSIGLVSLVLPNISYWPLRISLIVFGVCGVLVSATTWFLYARQTNFKYPFTAVTKTWKWFYRDALPTPQSFHVPIHTFQSKTAFERGKQAFSTQWDEFKQHQISGLSDPRESTYQDLQQLYVLHVNELYKNRFLTQLRSVLSVGLLASLVLSTGVLVVAWLTYRPVLPVETVQYSTGFTMIQASWRRTGQVRSTGTEGSEAQLLVNLRVQNRGSGEINISRIIAKDSTGLRIPIFIESMVPLPVTVSPNASVDIIGLIWVPGSLSSSLHRFETSP